MSDEASRCQRRLSMRVDDKCVISLESDEWAKLKNDGECFGKGRTERRDA